MFSLFDPLKLSVSDDQKFLEVQYDRHSESPIFDICDREGRIIKSGKITGDRLRIKVSDLLGQIYIFLILDGEKIRSKKFRISR